MNALVIVFLGLIVLLVILRYSLLTTRRTVLRVLGYIIYYAISIPFIVLPTMSLFLWVVSRPGPGAKATEIINDLRRFCGAARLFRMDHGRPLLPGEEASLICIWIAL
jgi:hypothetical protein